MPADLSRQAIEKALQKDWEGALHINQQILKDDPEDSDALMRAGRAFFELGRLEEAIASAKKVLKIDPLNQIAQRCHERWIALDPNEIPTPSVNNFPTNGLHKINLFLEEPGKTKIVNLHHLGDNKLVASLDCGDEVQIVAATHKVTCTNNQGHYVGRLPDDVATKTIEGLKQGFSYEAYVKSISQGEIKVFIRQIGSWH